ncbi:MAG: hypothetical protein ACYCSF_01950 [Acidimicrobiales bacterium]
MDQGGTLNGLPRLRAGVRTAAVAAVGLGLLAVPGLASGAARSPGAAVYQGSAGCPPSPGTAFGGPQWVLGCQIGGQGFTSPAVGTIDGTTVVVDASLSGWVYVLNAKTGAEMPGWPQAATLVGNSATAIDSSPAIAYLDGPDSEPSIVVGLGSHYVRDQNGGVMAWNANGSVRFRFHTKKTFPEWSGQPNNWTDGVFATPAIGDITGTGQQDIVFGSFDHFIYALNPSGKLLPGFPINRADTIWSSPTLADTTHSGQMDIIEGGDASGWRGPNGGPRCFSGWISDYRYLRGAPRLIWEHCLAETVWSSPAVTTFGATPVVVVGTSWFFGSGRNVKPAEDEVFAYNAATGAPMPGWPVNAGGPTFGSPAIAPLTAGGAADIVESSCADCLNGPSIVSAWNQHGALLWRTDITSHSELLSSPAVADVNGPGSTANDVLIGNVAGLFILDGATGQKIDNTGTVPINSSCNVGGTPAVTAVPGSATGYMMFTNCGFNGPTRTANEYLRAYNISAPSGPAPWPMFRANPQRTGVPDPLGGSRASCPTPSSPSGYRVIGAGGSVYGFGGAGFCGDLASQILPRDVAGIASTPNGGGYWLALRDGSVYAFGNAVSYGDLRGGGWSGGSADASPGAPIVGIAPSRDGKGYFILAGDGSVYGFGDARYQGAPGRYQASGAPVGIATDPSTGGYWVVTSSGHVYSYGAPSYGSAPAGRTTTVVGIAAAGSGAGYWLVSSGGGVFSFGSAVNCGTKSGTKIVGIAGAVSGKGYYLVGEQGDVYAFGKAPLDGSVAGRTRGDPVVGISSP